MGIHYFLGSKLYIVTLSTNSIVYYYIAVQITYMHEQIIFLRLACMKMECTCTCIWSLNSPH